MQGTYMLATSQRSRSFRRQLTRDGEGFFYLVAFSAQATSCNPSTIATSQSTTKLSCSKT